MTADAMRGELAVTIGGKDLVLRYNVRATRAILKALKLKNLQQLMGKLGEITLDEQLALVAEGIRDADNNGIDNANEWLEANASGPELGPVSLQVAMFLNEGMIAEYQATKVKLGIRDEEDPT